MIDGHEWFISGAHGAAFAIMIARTNAIHAFQEDGTTRWATGYELL